MLLSDGKENYTDFLMNLIIGATDFEVTGTNVMFRHFYMKISQADVQCP